MSSDQAVKKSNWPTYIWIFGVIFAFAFVFLIWALGPNLKHFTDTLIQRNDLSWYYWKLPLRNFWTMNIVWTLYLANQISMWAIIYFAQKNRYGFLIQKQSWSHKIRRLRISNNSKLRFSTPNRNPVVF